MWIRGNLRVEWELRSRVGWVVRVGSTEKPPLKEASRKNVPGRGTSECEALRFQASWHIQAA